MTRSLIETSMLTALGAAWLIACLAGVPASAAPRASANYTVSAETIDAGGHLASSSNYTLAGSFEPMVIHSATSSPYEIRHGYFDNQSVARALYEVWALAQGMNPYTIGAPSLDPDLDSVTNILEYAFGLAPLAAGDGSVGLSGLNLASAGTPVVYIDGADIRAIWTRKSNHTAAGLDFTIQFSSDLSTWHDSTDPATMLATDGYVDLMSLPYPLVLPDLTIPQYFRVKVDFSHH
jgi:hypothetical protein